MKQLSIVRKGESGGMMKGEGSFILSQLSIVRKRESEMTTTRNWRQCFVLPRDEWNEKTTQHHLFITSLEKHRQHIGNSYQSVRVCERTSRLL